ncbi:hypothetical protein EMCRGX_G016307 [Ephydatia muelleri]
MEFGSEHVYLNSSSDEEEYIPEEELEEGIVARPYSGYVNDSKRLAAAERSQASLEPQPNSEATSSSSGGHQLELQNSQPVQVQLNNNPAYLLDEDQPRPKPQPGHFEGTQQIPLSEESTQSSEKEQVSAAGSVSSSELSTPNPLPLPPKPPHGILKKDRSNKANKRQKVAWMSYLDHGGHKNTLRKYQPTLVELISLPDLLPHLNHHNVISEEENRMLLDHTLLPKERVLKFISILSDRSGMVYAAFLQALEDEHDHLGHRQLANILRVAGEKEFEDGGKHRGVVSRQVDTNVIAITFNTLVNAANVHAGDVVVCSNTNCTAILSHLSKLTDPEGDGAAGKKEWKCEFCGTCNFVELEPQEMPTKEETTYLLTPPPPRDQESSGTGGVGNTNLIFCIDVSGSMGVTVEVQGKRELKSDEKLRKLGISMQADIGNQYMPRQRRDVTYISRLQASSVQNAIEEQMAKLLNICPSQRVGVVAFSDEVMLLGDSKWKEVVVGGDRLSSVEELVKIGSELTPPPPLSQCRAELSRRVSELEEGGQTALGPALLLSMLLAGSIAGSKVIVCTDGLANKGVGNLDVPSGDEATAQQFYTDLGNIAVEKGVTVSLVTIKGVECRVLELGRVADTTGGNVTQVDPLTVSFEFSNIVANPIIATNVECKLILHNRLCIQAEGFQGNVMHASVGNVTSETEFSFEYKARRSPHSDSTSASQEGMSSFDTPVMVGGVPHLPFQLLTEYTGKDGSKLLRVVTKLKPVTQERQTAEKGIDFGVVGSHSVRSTAALASEGKIMEARAKAISYGRAMTRSSDVCDPHERSKFNAVMSRITPLERQLKATQMRASTNSSVPKSAHLLVPSSSSSQQGQLAQAASRSSKSKAASFLSPKCSVESTASPRNMSTLCSPTVCLTDAEEATELRRSATDTVAADLYNCKKVSSKSISQQE